MFTSPIIHVPESGSRNFSVPEGRRTLAKNDKFSGETGFSTGSSWPMCTSSKADGASCAIYGETKTAMYKYTQDIHKINIIDWYPRYSKKYNNNNNNKIVTTRNHAFTRQQSLFYQFQAAQAAPSERLLPLSVVQSAPTGWCTCVGKHYTILVRQSNCRTDLK